MKIVFLDSTKEDLKWMRHYYTQVFPAGSVKGNLRYKDALKTLKNHPTLGHSIGLYNLREFPIPKMPFSIIYYVEDNFIKIVRLWDGRRDRPSFLQK